ncbi:MAG: hypothetical protein R2752_11780 [Vicinamibacterales bacterium]
MRRSRLTIRAHARALVLALAVAAATCGGNSPTTPSPSGANVAGTWSGSWQYVTAGTTVTDTVSATLTQNGSAATGSWAAAGGAGGQLSFTTTGALTGTITISQTALGGLNCSASTTISGSSSASVISFTLGTLPSTGACAWATNQQFSLTR